ncbi:unnamed protein product [Lampetra planeri]
MVVASLLMLLGGQALGWWVEGGLRNSRRRFYFCAGNGTKLATSASRVQCRHATRTTPTPRSAAALAAPQHPGASVLEVAAAHSALASAVGSRPRALDLPCGFDCSRAI